MVITKLRLPKDSVIRPRGLSNLLMILSRDTSFGLASGSDAFKRATRWVTACLEENWRS